MIDLVDNQPNAALSAVPRDGPQLGRFEHGAGRVGRTGDQQAIARPWNRLKLRHLRLEGAIRPETWRECETHVGGTRELLELVVAIGNWRLFSSLLLSLEIPLEDGVAPWPPDGEVPAAAR